jgi:transposase
MDYMGIDHHKQYSHITLMDEKGKKLRSGKVANYRTELEKFLDGKQEIKAVIEAGRSSYTMVDLLDELGIDVTIAHPKEVRSIGRAKIKTDKRDSFMLAHLLRTELIPEVYKRSPQNRAYQRVLRQRAFYVGSITRTKNKIRSLLAQQREEFRDKVSRRRNLFSLSGVKFLKGLNLPDRDEELLSALIKTFTHLEKRRDETNGLVEKLYQEMPEARLIRSVPGYGIFLSVLVAVEIADIERFPKASKFLSYAGVIPSTHSSGGRSYHGKIVKQGNRWLRWAAVEAVYPGIKADFDIKCFYHRLKKRKGSNTAKVATARRMLTIIYRMLKENRLYIPYKR